MWILQRILLSVNPSLIRSGRNSNNFWIQGRTYCILLATVSLFFAGTKTLNSHNIAHIKSATIVLSSSEGFLFERGCFYQSDIVGLLALVDAVVYYVVKPRVYYSPSKQLFMLCL